MTEIQLSILIFYAGVFVGFLLKTLFVRKVDYSGTILVSHDEEKTLYSLELNENPEGIEFKRQVVFKVSASSENS